MHLPPTLSNSPSGRMVVLALIFVVLKLTATVLQVVLMRGNYRQMPTTALFRVAYVTGKLTPTLGLASVSIAAMLHRDWFLSWLFGLIAVAVAFLAVYVVRLRKQGKFFGLLDNAAKRNS